jgi:hypothetical protein
MGLCNRFIFALFNAATHHEKNIIVEKSLSVPVAKEEGD